MSDRKPFPMTPNCGAVKDVPLICSLESGHEGPHAATHLCPTIYWDASPPPAAPGVSEEEIAVSCQRCGRTFRLDIPSHTCAALTEAHVRLPSQPDWPAELRRLRSQGPAPTARVGGDYPSPEAGSIPGGPWPWLAHAIDCCDAWEPGVRIIGNVPAKALGDMLRALAAQGPAREPLEALEERWIARAARLDVGEEDQLVGAVAFRVCARDLRAALADAPAREGQGSSGGGCRLCGVVDCGIESHRHARESRLSAQGFDSARPPGGCADALGLRQEGERGTSGVVGVEVWSWGPNGLKISPAATGEPADGAEEAGARAHHPASPAAAPGPTPPPPSGADMGGISLTAQDGAYVRIIERAVEASTGVSADTLRRTPLEDIPTLAYPPSPAPDDRGEEPKEGAKP